MTPSAIRFHDLSTTGSSQEIDAMRRVLESGWLVLGREVEAFESAWASRCGVNHAVGVGNGLDAIEIGLRALGIGPGDEVITTPMTAVATVLGIIRAGATPVLADIEPSTGLLDPTSVERCVTPSSRALLLVHLYGHMTGMRVWTELCERNNLVLIEDCAQSHDARDEGRVSGSWGEFGACSFYPTKNLGAVGDAGALTTNSIDLALVARSLRNYGQSNRYEHPRVGMNSRLDELQAAVLSVRLSRLGEATLRRREVAHRYRTGITNPLVTLLAAPSESENHVYHLFVIRCDQRDALQVHLAEAGVETLIHYPIPAHHQKSLRDLRTDPEGLVNSEVHGRTCLSLPCAPHLTDADVDRVIEAVNAFSPVG